MPLTVNQLLLGRTLSSPPPGDVNLEGNHRASRKYLEHLTQAWWKLWMQQGFPTLLPYSRYKDTKRHQNLQVNDVCLVKYETKVAATYRLCRVSKVFPSEEGVVQTVEVQLRNRKVTKRHQPVKNLLTAVLRLVLLVPADEGQPRAQVQQEQAEVHAMSKSSGQPSQMRSANDHFGREEQQEELCTKVICHSSPPNSYPVNFLPLMQSFPMCGSTYVPGGMCHLNPAAQEFQPRPPGGLNWGPAWQQSSLQPACFSSQSWPWQQGFCGVGPWPCTPSFRPAFGVAPY